MPAFFRQWRDTQVRLRAWVIDRAPLPLLTNAHEAGIAVALMIVAVPLLSGEPPPPSVHHQVPGWIAAAWAWLLMASGFLTLWGLFTNRARMEWAGQNFMGHALTFYAVALVIRAGWDGFLASSIFGVLGLVSWWRAYKITHAPMVQARLVREAREAHRDVHASRRGKR